MAPWIVTAPTPKLPSGLGSLSAADVLKRLQTVFPSLRRHLNSAVSQLRPGNSSIIVDPLSVELSWTEISFHALLYASVGKSLDLK